MTATEKAKEAFLKDKKKQYSNMNMPDPIDRIMKFFAADVLNAEGEIYRPKDLEIEARNEIYKKLEWDNKNSSFDVISSFWTIFKCALIEIVQNDGLFSQYDNSYCITRAGFPKIPGGKKRSKKYPKTRSFPEKYLDPYKHADLKIIVSSSLEKYPTLSELAALTHSVANFTPCPNSPFNTVKGVHKSVCDFSPL